MADTYAARSSSWPCASKISTHAWWAAPSVSRRVEARRRQDPAYLTSRVLTMGTPLSEGNALHLDRTGDWRGALQLLAHEAEADVVEALTAVADGDADSQQAKFAHTGEVVGVKFLLAVPLSHAGDDLFGGEIAHHFLDLTVFFGKGEVHDRESLF